jgi:hypothetical protein
MAHEDEIPKSLRDRYDRLVRAGLYIDSMSRWLYIEHLVHRAEHKSSISMTAWLKLLREQEGGEEKS